jgi:hypothetical protein
LGQRRLLDIKIVLQHPEYLAYAGGIVLILAVGLKLGSIAR